MFDKIEKIAERFGKVFKPSVVLLTDRDYIDNMRRIHDDTVAEIGTDCHGRRYVAVLLNGHDGETSVKVIHDRYKDGQGGVIVSAGHDPVPWPKSFKEGKMTVDCLSAGEFREEDLAILEAAMEERYGKR